MKTYEDLFVETVLKEMDGIIVNSDVCTCGSFGGVPYVFYTSELDVADLFSKKSRRTRAQKSTDSELSPDEYEFKFLKNLGLADSNRNRLHYLDVKNRIKKGNDYFNSYVKRFKECANDKERLFVIRSAIADIREIIRNGCTCPGDYMFLRRFGLYA